MGTHPIFESDFDCLTVMGSRSRSRSRSRSDSRSRSRSRSSRSRSRSRSRSYSRSRSRSRSVLGHDDGYDPAFKGYRVKVADLNTRITKYELEKEFDRYGRVLDLILIRRCPTVCFIVYKHAKDARTAAKKLHNLQIWSTRLRAELAKPSGKSSRYQRSPRRNRSRSRSRRRSRSREERRRSRSRSRSEKRSRSRSTSKRREKEKSRSRSRRRSYRSRSNSRRSRS